MKKDDEIQLNLTPDMAEHVIKLMQIDMKMCQRVMDDPTTNDEMKEMAMRRVIMNKNLNDAIVKEASKKV